MSVDFFGQAGRNGIAVRGPMGPPGKRGKNGENSGYYAQKFQHSNIVWDIDYAPNYWIEGYDMQTKPTFKVLNKYDSGYDAVNQYPENPVPRKGTDSKSKRNTLLFEGTQYLSCPMDWNGTTSCDTLQVFIVAKFNDISGTGWRDGIFGNDNGGFDRFVSLHGQALRVSGAKSTSKVIDISTFPPDANPLQTEKFFVLSIHWNNRGESGCGPNKSAVYCNGKKLASFTAGDIDGTKSFEIGAINKRGVHRLRAEIGRFLVCGNRAHPMDEEEIMTTHNYLMEEWKLNEPSIPRIVIGGSYYAQYAQHCIDWDIDYIPNYWIDGYDVQTYKESHIPAFKVLNRYDSVYDAYSFWRNFTPTKGKDPKSGHHTLAFDGSQFLTCNMDWNGNNTYDNLQVFIVAKFDDISDKGLRDPLFGNDNLSNARYVILSSNKLAIGGVKSGSHTTKIELDTFPSDANPIQTERFFVLSVHWNNRGPGCGPNKSVVYCNGKRIATFTAGDTDGEKKTFEIGKIGNEINVPALKGQVGRFLVCGNRTHPMDEVKILNTHNYLMEEWKINESSHRNVISGNYYARYSQRCVDWDIEYIPNYWIEGYDLRTTRNGGEITNLTVLNRYNSDYNAVTVRGIPTKGTDPLSGRHTLLFNGSQYLTSPMDWNGTAAYDNLQVFIVAKYDEIKAKAAKTFTGGLFGNDNGGQDRFVCIVSEQVRNYLGVGGVVNETGSQILQIGDFPSDTANPLQTERFFVLSVHWNNRGMSGCGPNKSSVYCNGMKIANFTATPADGTKSFALGGITLHGHSALKGNIGQFLVCGARPHPMNEEDILKTHRYLMDEWKINDTSTVNDPASKLWVTELIESATDRNTIWKAQFKKDFIVSGKGQVLGGWVITKPFDKVQIIAGKTIYSTAPSILCIYMHCIAENETLENVIFQLYSLTTARVVNSTTVKMLKGKLVPIILFHNITARRGEKIVVRVFANEGSVVNFRVKARSTRAEITEARQWEAPELIVSKTAYPWGPDIEAGEQTTTIVLVNEIEHFQEIQIVIRGHLMTETVSLYPQVLKETDKLSGTTNWTIVLHGKLKLKFHGEGHKTLEILDLVPKETPHPYKIYSLYGIKLT